ncbi:MFS transporter [Haloimpatiens sp. FM7315]|uniref:MFS transporter n=1 Tax=Haloimpatiens sp. FM7315 TaxID=3298609 RepID=UPI00370A90A6
MLKNAITNKKNKKTFNLVFINLLVIMLADSIGNGMSCVILPAILNNLGGKSAWIGTIMGIQSLLGIVIFLPQATFINKVGERLSVRIGIFINVMVYIFYLFNYKVFIATGKFIEGFADRLLNSSISKVVYDETDEKYNRGKMRAYVDGISAIGTVVSPAIAAALMSISIKIPIVLSIIILTISFIFSKNFPKDINKNIKNEENFDKSLGIKSILNKYYLDHLKKYFKNKYIVAITIPSILFSCLEVFYSIILNLYLLNNKGFTYSQVAILWSVISIINILLQVPSGFLADKKKYISFLLCILFNAIGFVIIISNINSIYVIIAAILLINTGCVFYTTAMSALFGDLTTKEFRLSESESYRMIRGIGEGLLTITLSFVFDKNAIVALIIIGFLIILGTVITLIINRRFEKSLEV